MNTQQQNKLTEILADVRCSLMSDVRKISLVANAIGVTYAAAKDILCQQRKQ
jgi:hypothetical protein